MSEINIIKVTEQDIERLQAISKQTFRDTFDSDNSEEDMNKYLDDSFSLERLHDEVINNNSRFYFAKFENKIIGYLKINFGESQTELKEDSGLEIERIYVLKDFHGKRVGQVLYDKAIQFAKDNKAQYVWLGVWEKNARAIAFYKKNGFVEFDRHIFRLGNDEQIDIMMRLKL